MTNIDNTGDRIRQIRVEKQMTLKDLSALTDLSIAFISQVERNQADPSLASLKKIAAALGVKMKELFEFEQETVPKAVVKNGCGNHIIVHSVDCELLASIDKNEMEPVMKFISPKSESGMIDSHIGEEFVWIKSGSLEIKVGESTYVLNTGDSIYFKAAQPHGWINKSQDVPCEAIWINTPPLYT